MGYTNSGFARSLRVEVTNNGTGEKWTYQGAAGFTVNGKVYGAISTNAMREMSLTDFNARLADFKIYVEAMKPGLDFSSATVVEARIESQGTCPVGVTSSN